MSIEADDDFAMGSDDADAEAPRPKIASEPVVTPATRPAPAARVEAADDDEPADVEAAAEPAAETTDAAAPAEGVPAGEDELDEARAALPWYVVQTYAGFEMRVKLSLEERIRSKGLKQFFGRILVPQETVEEMVKGAKRTTKRKVFPCYILVQVALNDDTWHVVKDTPKVSGFIGDSRNPSPLSESEVAALLQQMEGGAKRPRPSKHFEEGDSVKVVDGPFAEFNGTVDEVKPDKGKLRVLISIFGRNTPVELDFAQVEKV